MDLDNPVNGWDSLVANFTVNLIPADPSQPHSARFKVFTQAADLTPFSITQTTNVLSAEVVIDFSEPVSIRNGDYFSTGAGTVINADDNATITYTLGNIIEISADQTTATSGVVDATDAFAIDGSVTPQNFAIGTISAGGTSISWEKDVNISTGNTNGLSGLDINGNGALDDSQLMWYTQISQKYTPTEYDPNITYDPVTNPSPELNFASQYRSTFDAVQHSITLRDLAATAVVPEPAVSGMLALSLFSLALRRKR